MRSIAPSFLLESLSAQDLEKIKRAAEIGDREAQNKLGYCYEGGKGGPKDRKKAMLWYRKAAEGGNADAQNNLGCCFAEGATKTEHREALIWFTKAANQGNATAQWNLATRFQEGFWWAPDLKKSAEWYKKAAENGLDIAYPRLISIFQKEQITKDLKRLILTWLTHRATEGDAKAQFYLGEIYHQGTGVDKDEKQAAHWYGRAAELRYQKAIDALESLKRSPSFARSENESTYSQTIVVPSIASLQQSSGPKDPKIPSIPSADEKTIFISQADVQSFSEDPEADRLFAAGNQLFKNGKYEDAVKQFTKAAELHHAHAQNNLAYCLIYEKGVGKGSDARAKWRPKAVEWYTKAAERGHVKAQCGLAQCFQYGWGIAKDEKVAFGWYLKAAKAGDAVAQYKIACALQGNVSGVVVEAYPELAKNNEEAVKWLRKAADQGHAEAQFTLAKMLVSGEGVTKDEKQAVELYRQAGAQNHNLACMELADRYQSGNGVMKDEKQAAEWIEKAGKESIYEHFQLVIPVSPRTLVKDDTQPTASSMPVATPPETTILTIAEPLSQPAAQENPKETASANEAERTHELPGEQKTRQDQFVYADSLEVEEEEPEKSSKEKMPTVPAVFLSLQAIAERDQSTDQDVEGASDHQSTKNPFIPPEVTESRSTDTVEKTKEQIVRHHANSGEVTAQLYLAEMLLQGKDFVENAEEAVQWFRMAAKGGNAEAQYNLAVALLYGIGTPRNVNEAVEWYKLAAQQEDDKEIQKEAQNKLEMCLALGTDCPADETEAVERLVAATQQGDARAYYQLGLIGLYGTTEIQNTSMAVACLFVAAAKEVVEAQLKLGRMLKEGEIFVKDEGAAAIWFMKAAEQKNAEAEAELANNPGLMVAHRVPLESQDELSSYRFVAACGFTDAQLYLAEMFLCGHYPAKDKTESLLWFGAAAMKGNAEAQHNLAVCFKYGIGTAKDEDAAREWFKSAAEQGHMKAKEALESVAQTIVEKTIKIPTEVPVPTPLQADEKEEKNTELDDAETQYHSVLTLLETDTEEAVRKLYKLVEKGFAKAQATFGFILSAGYGCVKNKTDGIWWIDQAAQKNAGAQYILGVILLYGIGFKKNPGAAIGWLFLAAKNGSVAAQVKLGHMFKNGEIFVKNEAAAAAWFLTAANQENVEAKRELANPALMKAYQTPLANREQYLRFRAACGDVASQQDLAEMFLRGLGCNKDEAEAVIWLYAAACGGNAEAMHNLAVCLEDGIGIQKDEKEALEWFRDAAQAEEEKLPADRQELVTSRVQGALDVLPSGIAANYYMTTGSVVSQTTTTLTATTPQVAVEPATPTPQAPAEFKTHVLQRL